MFSFSSRQQQQQRETLVIYNNKTLLLVLLLLCCCWELCVNVGVALCIHSRSAPNPTYLEQSGLLQSSYILQLHLLVLCSLRLKGENEASEASLPTSLWVNCDLRKPISRQRATHSSSFAQPHSAPRARGYCIRRNISAPLKCVVVLNNGSIERRFGWVSACRILCKAAASGNHELMRGQPAHTHSRTMMIERCLCNNYPRKCWVSTRVLGTWQT